MSYFKFLIYNLLVLVFGGFGLSLLKPILKNFLAANQPVVPGWLQGSPEFIGEVSLALTIAVLLNLLVEWVSRTRESRLHEMFVARVTGEINKELLRSVFKKNLPDMVVKQIEAHLFSGCICKLSWEATYYLKLEPDPDDRSKSIVTWNSRDKYKLKNMDRRKRDHEIAFEMEVTPHYESRSGLTSLEVNGQAVGFKEARNGSRVRLSHEITLKPGEEVEVTSRQTGAGPEEFHEVICSMLPVEDLVVTVIHPEGVRVCAMSLHPDEEELNINDPTQKQWRMKGVFPGQGLDIFWGRAS